MDTEDRNDMTGRPSGTKFIGQCPNASHPDMTGIKISHLRPTQSVGLASQAQRKLPCFWWSGAHPPCLLGHECHQGLWARPPWLFRTCVLLWRKDLRLSRTPVPSRQGGQCGLARNNNAVTCHTDYRPGTGPGFVRRISP